MGNRPTLIPTCGPYEQLDVRYDLENRAVWYYLNPVPRPCFNPALLRELRRFQAWVAKTCDRTREADGPTELAPLGYLILASRTPGVFNLGGDLNLFLQSIEAGDRRVLETYAEACIDVLHPNSACLEVPSLTTITLVQGDALGGGFEAAVSSTVLVAEERSRFGLPEILFNLIPGMGAYSFLSRKIGRSRAEKMILSGEVYTAGQLHEMGVVDVLAPDGQGEQVTRDFIRRHARRANAHHALARIRSRLDKVTREELLDITRIWVDAAMKIGHKDLRIMRRLVEAQNRKSNVEEVEANPACNQA